MGYILSNFSRMRCVAVMACFILSGCGSGSSEFDAMIGLTNGPTSSNTSSIVSVELLDNIEDCMYGSGYIAPRLYDDIMRYYPCGVCCAVVVDVMGDIVYVDFDVSSSDFGAIVVLNELERALKKTFGPRGVYKHKYVPYRLYVKIMPNSRMIYYVPSSDSDPRENSK